MRACSLSWCSLKFQLAGLQVAATNYSVEFATLLNLYYKKVELLLRHVLYIFLGPEVKKKKLHNTFAGFLRKIIISFCMKMAINLCCYSLRSFSVFFTKFLFRHYYVSNFFDKKAIYIPKYKMNDDE